MNEEQCEQIGLFRYGVISDFVNQISLEFGTQEELLRYKCNCKWRIPYSDRNQISRGIILHWIRLYGAGGKKIEALYPRERNDINKSRVIDKKTADSLLWLTKNSDIDNVPDLIREMKHRELIHLGQSLSISTVYRFLHKNNLMDYLKKRKNSYKRVAENSDENKLVTFKS